MIVSDVIAEPGWEVDSHEFVFVSRRPSDISYMAFNSDTTECS